MDRTAFRLSDRTLLEHISKLPQARANFKQLVRELGARGAARQDLELALGRLTTSGALLETRSGHFTVTGVNREYAAGRVELHRDGYGFLIPDNPLPDVQGDIYLPSEEASRLMHGDRAVVRVGRAAQGRAQGEIVRILRRAHPTIVGEFRSFSHGNYVKPQDDRVHNWIFIPSGLEVSPSGAVDRIGAAAQTAIADGVIVNAEILEFPDRNTDAIGRIVEILGRPDDFGVDVEITIRKYHLPHRFPPEAIEQAQRIAQTLPAGEIAARLDFRGLDVVTIDGETARDFDDAVLVNQLPSGNFRLDVHIADVSHYVHPGTPIDVEARLRGTSVYFPDRAVPMLPLELSTEICSLKPGVDRLTLGVTLEIDHSGDIVRQEFHHGVIRSVERMTYTAVHLVLAGDAGLRERYARLVPRFEAMQELALILNKRRTRRGSLDFDLPEPLIEFDEQGRMTGIARAPRNMAHRIIEEFMLAANEAVARQLDASGVPSLYRIHEAPDPERVIEFEQIALQFGHSLGFPAVPVKRHRVVDRRRDGRKHRRDIVLPDESFRVTSRQYQKLITRIEGRPEERILNYLMLRSLRQARYHEDNLGHFALATPCYTHFTSPIRRYPDLVVHRILSAVLRTRPAPFDRDALADIAASSSDTERRAAEAERELIEWKKVRYMIDRIGDQFPALIVNVTRFGFFVELDEIFVEGLVPIDTLPGERFLYHENVRKIIGARTRRQFSIGDRLSVALDRVDGVEKRLYFSVAPAGVQSP